MNNNKKAGAHLVSKNIKEAKRYAKPNDEESTSAGTRKNFSAKTKILICIGAILVLAVVAVFLFVNSKLNRLDYDDGKQELTSAEEYDAGDDIEVDTDNLEKWEAPKLSESVLVDDEDVLNILLLGTDGLELDYVDHVRSDATLLLSLNLKNGKAVLSSFERTVGMPITAGDLKGQYEFLTHIFAYGGADMVMEDVRDSLKINVEHYVRINFNSFIKVIDILGGIDVELTELEAWYLNQVQNGESVGYYLHHGYVRGDANSEEHEFVVGMNHLSGVMALSYARLRAIDNDWGRIARQRTVIQACSNKLKSADLATLNKLCNEILPLVKTNFTKAEIAELLLWAPKFIGVQFEQVVIPDEDNYGWMLGLNYRSVLAVDFDYYSQKIQSLLH